MHFSTFNIVHIALVPQHINIICFYLKVQNSLLLVVFCQLRQLYASKYVKWQNGPCYVEIELRSGILEVKTLQKELLFMIL